VSERNLSPKAKRILDSACQESKDLGHFYVGIEHVFIALTKIKNGLTHNFLQKFNLTPKQVRNEIIQYIGNGNNKRYWPGIRTTPRCDAVLKLAGEHASKDNRDLIEEKDILWAILREGNSIPVRQLETMGIADFLKVFEDTVIDYSTAPRVTSRKKNSSIPGKGVPQKQSHQSDTPLLDQFGRDLTQLAEEGKLDPVFSREDEIIQVIETLVRKTKCNPVLIGEAGVGKTAIVEGLALRLSEGKLPAKLLDKRIIQLDMASIVAGTRHRGEFEGRLTGIVNESKRHPEIILFLDEIHTIKGAGDSEGAIDASNILKPSLARGDIKCIGATTTAEYYRYIEKDPTLERRFMPIMISEPSPENTIELLKKIKDSLEEHYQVTITESAIHAAVKLSVTYIHNRHLPDKAKDLLETACSHRRVSSLSVYDGDKGHTMGSIQVTSEDVAHAISKKTGIPIGMLTVDERERLLHMADVIRNRVVGQDEAVQKLVKAIQRARVGLKNSRRPAGVFLFLGPSGVGKTELAKATAELLLGSEKDMIRLDMSEHYDRYEASRLIGAPPGYLGYDEEGQLTGQLRRKPHSVVLLDEIEKAHPAIHDIFLQVFDEGRLTDSKGNTVDARNAIFIMTSNIGLDLSTRSPIGFKATVEEAIPMEDRINNELKKYFRIEFLNRIDATIPFRTLAQDDMIQIFNILFTDLEKRVAEQEILLNIGKDVPAFICRDGYDPNYGARSLERSFERLLKDPLSEKIVTGELKAGDRVRIALYNGNIAIRKQKVR